MQVADKCHSLMWSLLRLRSEVALTVHDSEAPMLNKKTKQQNEANYMTARRAKNNYIRGFT